MVCGASRPETCLRLGRRLPAFAAASSSVVSTGGKSETWVIPCRSIKRTASSASKRDTSTLAPPACIWASALPSAVTWKSGSARR